ncbi:MAG TPA: GDSL-type esterase/lipase family protein [Solirubrobacteraceae bacterium]|jgi:lysophospholipase L1-like esterase|nr:GDSL-type esterase/lipase family protein [Solirubrobacteraceae bacterium]
MSVFQRAHTRVLVCCVAALGALAFTASAGAATVGNTYLALGDSLAYGYHAAQFKTELESKGYVEPETFDEGYVNDFGAALKLVNPKLKLIDDGCPGETSETFIKGSGIPGYCAGGPTGTPFPYAFLHHSYSAHTSQLADALAILKETPNVSPITLDIGANDVLQFLASKCGFPATFTCSPAEIEAEFGHIAANVYSILTQLHGAAPKAQIVLIGLYNPYPTVLPAPGGDKTTAALNTALASVAASVPDTSFANPEPPFNPSILTGGAETTDLPTICAFTAMCPGGTFNPTSPNADIHPTTLGYGVMAGVLGVDFFTH